jgi:signal transduction histidine kinase
VTKVQQLLVSAEKIVRRISEGMRPIALKP